MAKKILTVPGFQFSGISAGIKEGNKLDLALIYSEIPATVAGVFTTNRVQAAPVVVSKKNIRSGIARAVIVNSGNANACTGKKGLRDAEQMVKATARALRVPDRQVLVCSTGKIGLPLPIDRIVKQIPSAVKNLSPNGLMKSAKAILTTDNSVKIAASGGKIGGKSYRLIGFAKGAGMVEPHMATMLAFVMTDLDLPRAVLKSIFQKTVDQTFNRITVDGDTSTNDTALILANGAAGNRPFSEKSPEGRRFQKNLFQVLDSLARQMVVDGEGATKCVRIEVRGARHSGDAQKVAYTVANSPLVKTSFFGEDPNWGRIVGAAGRSGATLNPDRIDIYYHEACVARRGVSTGPQNETKAKKIMRYPQFTVTIDLHQGQGSFQVYASDLSLDYVKLNSCYRS